MPLLFILFISLFAINEPPTLKLGLLKYNGGGDWYSNPTALPNLAQFCNKNMGTNFDLNYGTVEVGSLDIFNYPFLHLTGHGNVVFSDREAANLRQYLMGGGFLHIDDNYGMDVFVRQQMKKVFPELDFVELPVKHPVYNQAFNFPEGLPKIHIHDNKPAQGFGLFYEGRLVCFYTYECDLGDGWEDPRVHNDSPETRTKALRMGANLIQFVFNQ
jgi:hypothetical protein